MSAIRNSLKMLTAEQVLKLPYSSFVGWINQWNVPPGALSTISEWAVFGNVSQNSFVVEVACTTGFSIREMAIRSGCTGVGVDISQVAVEEACVNRDIYASNINVDFVHADATEYIPPKIVTHVIVGAALRFFDKPSVILERVLSWFQDTGYLLAAPFYTHSPIPDELLVRANEVFEIVPTTTGYKETMSLYKGFDVTHESRHEIYPETDEDLAHYCTSIVARAERAGKFSNASVRDAAYSRLMEIKKMSNALRPFQRYSVLILHYNKKTFPDRYTEIF